MGGHDPLEDLKSLSLCLMSLVMNRKHEAPAEVERLGDSTGQLNNSVMGFLMSRDRNDSVFIPQWEHLRLDRLQGNQNKTPVQAPDCQISNLPDIPEI